MRPRTFVTALSATLLASTLLAAGPVASAHGRADFSFKDMQQAQWAAPYVSQLAFQGVVKGTGSGDFNPNGHVTRAQAVAMIVKTFAGSRSSGNVQLHFADTSTIPAWARPSIQTAVAMGLVANEGSFRPMAPATRAQVASWVVGAMGLSAQAASAPTQILGNFTDGKAVPASDRGRMALLLDLGLMSGKSNRHLAPLGVITRAQMASILARAEISYGAPNTSLSESLLTGTLTSVSTTASTSGSEPTQGSITFATAQGSTDTVGVAANAAIFTGSTPTTLGSLAANANIVVGIDSLGNAVFIEASPSMTPGPLTGVSEVEGTVTGINSTSITVAVYGEDGGAEGNVAPPLALQDHGSHGPQPPTGQTLTFKLTPETVVMFHGMAAPLSSVAVGSQVHLRLDGQGNVLAITIQQMTETVSGTIAGLREESMLLTDGSGNLIIVRMDHNTSITDAQNNPLSPSQLSVGDSVEVTGIFGEDGLRAQSITDESAGASSQATPGTVVQPIWAGTTPNAQSFNDDLARLYTPTNVAITSGTWAGQNGWGVLSIQGSTLTFNESAITQDVLTNNGDWQSPTASPWSVPAVFETPSQGVTETSVSVVAPSGVTGGYPTSLTDDSNYSTEELIWLPNDMQTGTYTYTVQWSDGSSNTYTVVVNP